MPTYKYEAAYAGGERASGVVEAVSEAEAVAQIRQNCEMVLSLKEVPKLAAVRNPAVKLRKINAKSLALVCRQFAIILKSGMPLPGRGAMSGQEPPTAAASGVGGRVQRLEPELQL